MNKIRLAIVTAYGMDKGGTEKFLQTIAANLPKSKYDVFYYYIDSNQEKISETKKNMLLAAGVKLIPYQSEGCVYRRNYIRQEHSNFFNKFNYDCDLILTGSCGLPEEPMRQIKKIPILQSIHYVSGVDNSYNISRVLHISEFSRKMWIDKGGDKMRTVMVSHPISIPHFKKINLREQLGIDSNTLVFGMHQRNDDYIFSDIPLNAYKKIENDNTAYILLGGSIKYREQAKQIGVKNVYFLDATDDNDVIYSFLDTINVYSHGRFDGELNSTALAEAMAFGLPIISHPSNIYNGHLEVIRKNGVIAKTVDDYANAMKLMQDDEVRYSYGIESKKVFKKNYDLKGQIEYIMSVFENVLDNPYPKKIRRTILDFLQMSSNIINYFLYFIRCIGRKNEIDKENK